jgi:hypothetical protein
VSKSSVTRRTRAGRKRVVNQQKQIHIFISYASEDSDLVTSIVNLLNDTFRFAPLAIDRDVEIKTGENWIRAINKALDNADILFVVFTDRMKLSHSYTGYEIGYFNRSVEQSPKGGGGFDRFYIPFCIGADIPETMHDIQGIPVAANEVYKVLKTKVEAGREIAVEEGHPVFKLLTRISDLVLQVLGRPAGQINLKQPAAQLYRVVHEYMQGRVSQETYPERKLIIRSATRPEITRDGADLANSAVELEGDFLDVFGIPEAQSLGREYKWPEFLDKIPEELRGNCSAGIRLLTGAVIKNIGDNYHVVTTVERDKSFRLFVSKIVTYVSQKTEIDIYIVQMRQKEYGDPYTSRLLKAISAGLKFRFLFLEAQSEFRPEKLGYPTITASDLRAKISEMLGEMDLVLREAVEADLRDPHILIDIYGKGQEKKMQDMMDAWERDSKALYTTANDVLSSSDDASFRQKKEKFIAALTAFCASVEQMNHEFTSRVLALLLKHIGEKIVTFEEVRST